MRDSEELQRQAEKVISFDEYSSNKIIKLKEFIISKFPLLVLILGIILISFYFIFDYVSFIVNNTNLVLSDYFSGFFSCCIDCIIPVYLIVLGFKIRKSAKRNDKDVEPFDSLNPYIKKKKKTTLDYIFSFARVFKIVYIIYAVLFILSSISMINIEILTDVYESFYEQPLTEQMIYQYQMMGYNFLICGGIYALISIAFNRSNKIFFKEIIFDEENKYVDMVILSSFLFALGVIFATGLILNYAGITNPICKLSFVKINNQFDVVDVLYIINILLLIGFTTLSGIMNLKIRDILMNNFGKTNKVKESKPVYTVTIDDLKD